MLRCWGSNLEESEARIELCPKLYSVLSRWKFRNAWISIIKRPMLDSRFGPKGMVSSDAEICLSWNDWISLHTLTPEYEGYSALWHMLCRIEQRKGVNLFHDVAFSDWASGHGASWGVKRRRALAFGRLDYLINCVKIGTAVDDQVKPWITFICAPSSYRTRANGTTEECLEIHKSSWHESCCRNIETARPRSSCFQRPCVHKFHQSQTLEPSDLIVEGRGAKVGTRWDGGKEDW